MRKPVLAPSGTLLNNLISAYLFQKEIVMVTIQKVPTRLKRINVDTSEFDTHSEFIMTGISK